MDNGNSNNTMFVKSPKALFKKKEIYTLVLEWPSQSPDHIPVQMLWTDLKKAMHTTKFKNLNQLWEYCIEEWAKTPDKGVKSW